MRIILTMWFYFACPVYSFTQGWVSQTSGTSARLDAVDFFDAEKGIAVGTSGTVRVTTDGGATWLNRTGVTTDELVGISFVAEDTAFAASLYGSVVRTTDGGGTWALISSITTWPEDIGFTTSEQGVIVGSYDISGEMYRTVDGGSNWSSVWGGFEEYIQSVSLSDTRNGTAVGYCGKSKYCDVGGVIWRTTNGGTSWFSQKSGTNALLWGVFFTDSLVGTIVGPSGSVLRTTNAGQLWEIKPSGTGASLRSVGFSDFYNGFAVGLGGVILRTTDGGMTWIEQESGVTTDLYSVACSDASTATVVGASGVILHTTTGGTGIDPPPRPSLISPPSGTGTEQNPTLRWVGTDDAIRYTVQVGRNAAFSNVVLNTTDIDTNSFRLPNLALDQTYYWRVSVTDTTGTSQWSETWNLIITILPLPVVLDAPQDNGIVTSDTASLSWHPRSPAVDRYWIEADTDSLFSSPFIDSTLTDTSFTITPVHNLTYWWKVRAHNQYGWGMFSEVWRFLSYQEIPEAPMLASPDSGATGVSTSPTLSWNASAGTEFYMLQISESSDFSSVIVDEDSIGALLFDVTGLTNGTFYYWRVNARNALGVSDWSEVWSFTTLITGVDDTEAEIPTEFFLSQNYPNPFNPSTRIRYGLPSASHVRLEVFDLIGESVAVLVNGERAAGNHGVVFDGSNLANGVYLYRLAAGGFVKTRKLVLMR